MIVTNLEVNRVTLRAERVRKIGIVVHRIGAAQWFVVMNSDQNWSLNLNHCQNLRFDLRSSLRRENEEWIPNVARARPYSGVYGPIRIKDHWWVKEV